MSNQHSASSAPRWTPAKGDRVMYNDATWPRLSGMSRRMGRRGGVCTSIFDGDWANVRWDGVKHPAACLFEDLCPDDPSKHEPPPKVLREAAKAARMRAAGLSRRAVLANARRWIETLAGAHGPVTDEHRSSALAFAKTYLNQFTETK